MNEINHMIIKLSLVAKNMTVKECAENLDLNINTVSAWINGRNLDQINNFLNLLVYLNLEINDIKKG